VAENRKDTLRAQVGARRRELVPGRDRAADAEALAIDALAAAHDAGVRPGDWVAAYESLPSEPPTEASIAALAARGIRVMVPITLADWDLDWREVGTEVALGVDAVADARLVLVPAQGVDGSGTRLGRGKGCYDRVLPRTRGLAVAVVHPWEVTDDDLPAEPHDRPVDAVMAAGLGVRWFRGSTPPGRT
jgi:5-formyltetrahydrofolate cyclo-ligase